MISAVSNVSFRGDAGADLISAPGKFSAQAPVADMPADSFESTGEKKSKKGLKAALITAGLALAAFVGLGYAVKSGKLKHVDIAEGDGFFKSLWTRTKNVGAKIGGWAESCYNTVAGWFGHEGKKAADAAEAATEAVTEAAEGAAAAA